MFSVCSIAKCCKYSYPLMVSCGDSQMPLNVCPEVYMKSMDFKLAQVLTLSLHLLVFLLVTHE